MVLRLQSFRAERAELYSNCRRTRVKSQEADREDLRKKLDMDYAFRQQQDLKARSSAARERAQREAFRRADKEHALKTRMAEVKRVKWSPTSRRLSVWSVGLC